MEDIGILLVFAGDVVEDRSALLACSGLIENVEILQGLELILLVHVVFGHNLFKLRTRHVHAVHRK